MERIRQIIEDNKGVDFVVMTHNSDEFEILRDILVDMKYEAAIPLAPLKEMMDNAAEESNYQCGWRISEGRGVSWNESVEHWKYYYADILEINQDGELVFVE